MNLFNGTQVAQTWINEFEAKYPASFDMKSYLDCNVNDILDSIGRRVSSQDWKWTRKAVKTALLVIEKELLEKEMSRKDTEGHGLRNLAIGLGVAAGAAVLAPVAIVGGLGLLGFSAVGPVAGSAAAAIQSVFYGGAVSSGSLFAIAQSMAMGGGALATVEAAAAGVALTTATAATAAGVGAAVNGTESVNRLRWPSDFVPSDKLVDEIENAD